MNDIALPALEHTGDDYFDLNTARAAIDAGKPVRFPPFDVVHLPEYGLSVCLNLQRDPVQRSLRGGNFFEQEELELLKNYVKRGAHIIDIGANIGNHALFFATQLKAQRVVVIEPNPLALAPLVANVLVNQLTNVIDIGALGVGLSDRSESGFGMKRHDRNLGATKMFAGKGKLQVHAGDDLFADETPDFIKIDVEGMEMQVLAGLEATITAHRPLLLIEIDNENDEAFEAWRQTHKYDVVNTKKHYRKNCNYMLRAAEKNRGK